MEITFIQDKKQFINLPSDWKVLPFTYVFEDVTGGNAKLKKNDCLTEGLYPVIDQGKDAVTGYVNNEKLLCKTKPPVIIFGDHTRSLKFIDFPFILGADGTKILIPKIEADMKYLFHFLKQINIPDTGYNRHFKYLKKLKLFFLLSKPRSKLLRY